MRTFPALCRSLALLCLGLGSTLGFACDSLPSGQTLWIRLTSPITTYTARPGDAVKGVLTEAVECNGQEVFPVGTEVEGSVHSVRKVGWGIRHETAALDLQFNRMVVTGAAPASISAVVTEVENAREQVTKGTIQGVRSSDTPQGRINSRLRHLPTWNPYSDLGLIVFKAGFPIFPEPEIYLPQGTDLRLKLNEAVSVPVSASAHPPENFVDVTESVEREELATSTPSRTTTVKMVEADVINLAFVGSREEIDAAFREAGWVNSDTFTKHSFMRDFYAFLNDSGYPQAPMREFLLDGEPPAMNWEKSLNSYARRDHLRIWEWSDPSSSQTVWLSAATHDAGAALSVKHHQFVHHISPDIDEERSKVIRDLSASGCVQSVSLAPRRGIANISENATGDPVTTDGALAVVELKPCQPAVPELASAPQSANFKAGNHAFRYFRRQILTFRSDIWRANIIYGVYDLGHMSVTALRHHPAAPQSAYATAKPSRQPSRQIARQHASESMGSAEILDGDGLQ
ncbi:MAG: LssY C-terminal domain-containing protein [Candidatus Korobacteraceae bacterium]